MCHYLCTYTSIYLRCSILRHTTFRLFVLQLCEIISQCIHEIMSTHRNYECNVFVESPIVSFTESGKFVLTQCKVIY